MKKTWLLGCVLVGALAAFAQEMDPSSLSKEEEAAVAAILANVRKEETQTKQEKTPQPQIEEKKSDSSLSSQKQKIKETPTEEEEPEAASPTTCLTVAFVDIDEAFNAHPRTVDVKEQIRLKILAKEEEVQGAKQLIQVLQAENRNLA
ncbi:MAG: hypothetical protein J5601_02275, partial [Elusimicrobiaceae bacterium]|nr:hypothetical protein [Elusimicrobiaceae bacterium]